MKSSIVLFSILLLGCCVHVGNGGDTRPSGSFVGEVPFAPLMEVDGLILVFEGEREQLLILAAKNGYIIFNRKVNDGWVEFPVARSVVDNCMEATTREIVQVQLRFCRGDPAVSLAVTGFKFFYIGHYKVMKKDGRPAMEQQGI